MGENTTVFLPLPADDNKSHVTTGTYHEGYGTVGISSENTFFTDTESVK